VIIEGLLPDWRVHARKNLKEDSSLA
jgi:hypothetical protein